MRIYMSKKARQSYNKKSHYAKVGKRINRCNQHVNITNEHNNQTYITYKHIKSLNV